MRLNHPNPQRRRSDGSAVIVIMVILLLLLAYAGANHITLKVLDGELKLLEQRHQERLEQLTSASVSTNLPSMDPAVVENANGPN